MAGSQRLNTGEVAARIDRASSKVDEHEALEIAAELQREGLAVVQQGAADEPSIEQVVAALDEDPKVALQGESMLPRPRLRIPGRRRRPARAGI
jgi:hypothetical protein